MMEQGQLVSSEVLPKVAAELKKAALEGGAFDKALQGLRVTEGQMITETQRAGDTIFKSGFSEGLSNLYKTISEILKTSGPQLEKLGRIFGKVFDGLAYSLKLLEPIMKVTIDNFELIFGALAIRKIQVFAKTIQSAALTTNLALAKAFLPITLAVAAAEELVSLFSDKIVGNLEEASGAQFNILTGKKTDIISKNGKLYNGGNERGIFSDKRVTATEKEFSKMSSAAQVKELVGNQYGLFDLAKMLFKPIEGAEGQRGAVFSSLFAGSSSASQGGNTYIFNNSSADEMKQIIGYVGATSGMSTTK